jgi:hypothetical protein
MQIATKPTRPILFREISDANTLTLNISRLALIDMLQLWVGLAQRNPTKHGARTGSANVQLHLHGRMA